MKKKYFTNIGPSLASKIPVSEKSLNSFLSPKLVNSLFLETANEQEIVEICNNCRSGTAVGNDNISMNLIKETINLVISPLASIINLSITSGIVPEQLKIARVIGYIYRIYLQITDQCLFYPPSPKF